MDGWVSNLNTNPKTTRNWGVGESLTSTPIQNDLGYDPKLVGLRLRIPEPVRVYFLDGCWG